LARHATELAKRGMATSAVGIGNGYVTAALQAVAENGAPAYLMESNRRDYRPEKKRWAARLNDENLVTSMPLRLGPSNNRRSVSDRVAAGSLSTI
jgi:hypothetical protein